MSYHVQQQPQQKSFGVLAVIAFHILLFWGLINGFKINVITHEPDAVRVTNINQNTPLPPPPTNNVQPKSIDPTVIFTAPKTVTIDNPVDELPPSGDPTSGIIGGGGTVAAIPSTLPKALQTPLPDYPAASKRLGEEGVTGLRLFVTAEGKITDVELTSSSNFSRLDEAALKFVPLHWKYTPCTQDGKPVACWFNAKLRWRLENEKR